jgi:hypothetical protein
MIENMKNMKDALNKIPDEVLENYIVGLGESGFGMGCGKGDDEVSMGDNDVAFKTAHPEIVEVCRYFENIVKAVLDEDSADVVNSNPTG